MTKKEQPTDGYKAICDIRVLRSIPRHEDARKLLEEIASRVQPIMIKHKWKTDLLSEFWPEEQASLMGLNVIYGRNIKLRLRKADKEDEFVPIHNIIDTMLHQLCHYSYDSSDHLDFKNLLNRLRKEYDDHMGNSSHKEYDDHMGSCVCGRIPTEKERPEDHYKASEIWALENMPRHEDAQKLLEEIAIRVQPIMIKHKWRTELLSEFWPEQASLMGLNVKQRGLHIKLRLRRADNQDEFITTNDILDTMLHQLCYNNHHSSDHLGFKNLLNDLRKEVGEDLSSHHPQFRILCFLFMIICVVAALKIY